MFFFVIWDCLERTIFEARDRLGIKPFYYVIYHGSFIIASEIKSIIASGLIEPEMNFDGISDYLTFQFCLFEKSLFKEINKLLLGYYMWISSEGNITITKYWALDFSIDIDHSEVYFQNTLSDLLHDAVRIQMRGDVPVGSHLSGGGKLLRCYEALNVL